MTFEKVIEVAPCPCTCCADLLEKMRCGFAFGADTDFPAATVDDWYRRSCLCADGGEPCTCTFCEHVTGRQGVIA
jgi:hypothetical protein